MSPSVLMGPCLGLAPLLHQHFLAFLNLQIPPPGSIPGQSKDKRNQGLLLLLQGFFFGKRQLGKEPLLAREKRNAESGKAPDLSSLKRSRISRD